MPWFDFVWTQEVIDHLAHHGVVPAEFEHVVMHPTFRNKSNSSDRDFVKGYTKQRRYLGCVFECDDGITIIPVTAFELRR